MVLRSRQFDDVKLESHYEENGHIVTAYTKVKLEQTIKGEVIGMFNSKDTYPTYMIVFRKTW
jgi:hypothetical protein